MTDPLETMNGQMVDALNVLTRRHTALSLRHTALLAALDALVADLNTSSRSCRLFGCHDEPLDAEGQRVVRVITDRLAAEIAKHRVAR
jgi:hypothetical protein